VNVQLSINNVATNLKGQTRMFNFKGELEFSEFVISATPGQDYILIISSSNIDSGVRLISYPGFIEPENINLNVFSRLCNLGESLVNSECIECVAGTYSLGLSPECIDCMENA
jgi:hypothetical protein